MLSGLPFLCMCQYFPVTHCHQCWLQYYPDSTMSADSYFPRTYFFPSAIMLMTKPNLLPTLAAASASFCRLLASSSSRTEKSKSVNQLSLSSHIAHPSVDVTACFISEYVCDWLTNFINRSLRKLRRC